MRRLFAFILTIYWNFSFAQDFNYFPAFSNNQVIVHKYYTLSYSEDHEQAEWVAYKLKSFMVHGSIERTDDFRSDALVKTGSSQLSDFIGSGYDRGQLAPAADFKFSKEAMSESFYLSTISPQDPSFNRGIWRQLEETVRSWAIEENELIVITGPILNNIKGSIGKNKVSIPSRFFKIVYDYTGDEKMIGFIIPNEKGKKNLNEYIVSVDVVEAYTGLDFFPDLPDDKEEQLELTYNKAKWKWNTTILSSE